METVVIVTIHQQAILTIVFKILHPLAIHNPSRIGRAASMRLVQLSRGASLPLTASRATAVRSSTTCLYGLCVVDNPSLRNKSRPYQFGV